MGATEQGVLPTLAGGRGDGSGPMPEAGRVLRVLHLEDSPSDAALAREFLEAEGIRSEVRRVETRQQFEEALAAGGVDLILADFQLPAFDGITAFLLARQASPDVPFIMLTGKLGEEYAIDTLALGVTDYVLKQRMARLAAAVRHALEQQRERRLRREAEGALRRHQEHLEGLVRQRTALLEERNAQLAVANRDLEMFVASATHDLRTPLVVIGGFARRLEATCAGRIEPAEVDMLRKVIGAEERMERLLDDLLAFFRASKAAPELVAIDMEAAAREAFEGLQPLVGGRRVRLDIAALPRARGDAAMVRQVLVNLLANALKYTQPRDTAVIEISGREDGEAPVYCVQDNGIGFDMRDSGRLFEPFQRLHDPREFAGTGIGLATVKRIVEKHGGKVWANSAVNRGARFCFTLPRAAGSRGRAADGPPHRVRLTCAEEEG